MRVLTLTVSQLNRYVKAVLEEDPRLSDVYVKGEIANFTRHYKSGHLYFSLRDNSSSIKAVMFKSDANSLRFQPENGMALLVQGHVGLYERDGNYQLYVTDMQPDGAGALAVAFEQRKAKLAGMGYFDEAVKKPLPPYPKRIGVVTSETGAALQDIVNVLTRRYPVGTLVLCPSPVQGDNAVPELIRAIRTLDGKCDVMIVGRGGGSVEDLWCFNDEMLAKAVYRANTPIISAVGHETDFTICDFVADVRAPTPSAAAEIAVPSVEAITRRLSDRRSYLMRSARLLLEQKRMQLQRTANARPLRSALYMVEKKRERLDFLYDSLYNNKKTFLRQLSDGLSYRASLLDSLSPLRILNRGYAAVTNADGVSVTAKDLNGEDDVTIRFSDGSANAKIYCVQGKEAGKHEKRNIL